MNNLFKLLMQYKIFLLFCLLVIFGTGMFFFMGQSSGERAGEKASTPVVTQSETKSASDTGKQAKSNPEQQVEKSKDKGERDLQKMQDNIEQRNEKIDNDETIGTVKNGTVKMAPPKFKTSDLPTRQADFHD